MVSLIPGSVLGLFAVLLFSHGPTFAKGDIAQRSPPDVILQTVPDIASPNTNVALEGWAEYAGYFYLEGSSKVGAGTSSLSL